jgi:hypothetical protein
LQTAIFFFIVNSTKGENHAVNAIIERKAEAISCHDATATAGHKTAADDEPRYPELSRGVGA